MIIRRVTILVLVLGCTFFNALVAAPLTPENALFLSGTVLRKGSIYKPPGDGPFPVMIYNQASSRPAVEHGDSVPFASLARLYNSKGYVLFLPGRRQASENEQQAVDSIEDQGKRFMAALEIHNADIEAAIAWLKSQAYVDEKRIFMSGHSTGAIQSLLIAKKKKLGVLGIVAFSPGSKIWGENALLRDSLMEAVKTSRVPIFLVQPQNDFSLGPSDVLGQELMKKGGPNRTRIYLPQGSGPMEGNSFAFTKPEIWQGDVFEFLDEISRKQVQ